MKLANRQSRSANFTLPLFAPWALNGNPALPGADGYRRLGERDEPETEGTDPQQHPDEFINHLLDLDTAAVVIAAQKCRAGLKTPPKTAEEYLEILERQSLPKTVAALRQWAAVL